MARKRRIQKPEGQEQQWRTSIKRMRGEGVFYDEAKSETLQVALTPTAKEKIKQKAALNKLSVSEYLERWIREIDGLILPYSRQSEDELEQLRAERDDYAATVDEFIKDHKRWQEKALTPEKRDRILKTLGVGKQSPTYKRVNAALDQIMS